MARWLSPVVSLHISSDVLSRWNVLTAMASPRLCSTSNGSVRTYNTMWSHNNHIVILGLFNPRCINNGVCVLCHDAVWSESAQHSGWLGVWSSLYTFHNKRQKVTPLAAINQTCPVCSSWTLLGETGPSPQLWLACTPSPPGPTSQSTYRCLACSERAEPEEWTVRAAEDFYGFFIPSLFFPENQKHWSLFEVCSLLHAHIVQTHSSM